VLFVVIKNGGILTYNINCKKISQMPLSKVLLLKLLQQRKTVDLLFIINIVKKKAEVLID